MEKGPTISVIMSVYNSALYLREAVNSILNQTYKDFEFLIVDDKSTDDSLEILRSYSDSRIKIFENLENIGLTKNLNKLLKFSNGEFIARMDADDVSLPNRFELQLTFLNQYKTISFCGTNIISFEGKKSNLPLTNDQISLEMLSRNPFAHPTMFFRKMDFFNNNLLYDEHFGVAQDYELWTRAILVLNGANIHTPLLRYRNHENRIGVKKLDLSISNSKQIKYNYLKKIGFSGFESNQIYHDAVFGENFKMNREMIFLRKVDLYMNEFYNWNAQSRHFNEKLVIERWSNIFFGNMLYEYNLHTFQIMRESNLNNFLEMSYYNKFKFLIKCLINYKII